MLLENAAIAQAQQSREQVQRVQQEWKAKLQSEVSLLQQKATASMGSTTAQHEQAFAAQQSKHAQQVQALESQKDTLLQTKQSLQAKVQETEQLLKGTQIQMKDLRSMMTVQSQEAQQAVQTLTREHESARLSQQGRHSAEIVTLQEQQQVSVQHMQQELLHREQQADQNYSDLLARHGMLERRFNAR